MQKSDVNMVQHTGHFNNGFKNIRFFLNQITTYYKEVALPLT